MNNEKLRIAIERIVEYLCNYTPRFKKTKSSIELVRNFWKETGIVSEKVLWEYMVFQASLKDNEKSRIFAVNPSALIGPVAIKNWKKRNKIQLHVAVKKQREYGWKSPFEEKDGYSEEYREMLRKRFWNTERGFLWCQQYEGWLFDKDKCQGCDFFKACENLKKR